MINAAPCTNDGRLQFEIEDLKRQLHRKSEKYETHSLSSRLDSLERSNRNLSSIVDELLFKVQQLEENQRLNSEKESI